MIFVQTIQIDLIGYTKIRAHELARTETGSWTIASASNMKLPLGNPEEKGTKEYKVDSKLWDRVPLPNTVAPSFETCNLSRTYELEVKVGLAHGTQGRIKVCQSRIRHNHSSWNAVELPGPLGQISTING